MEESKKVPAIRFRGFTNEWEERKLGDILIVKDSARVPNSLWTDKGIKYLRSSDLANPSEDGLFISAETYEMYKRQTGAPEAGDVLFASGGDIGFTYFYEGDEPIYVQGGAILYIKTSSSCQIDGKYLKIYFESNRMRRYIEEASAGGTIKHFTLMPANNAPLYYPSKAEQLKLGDFFMQLEKTISLHQRKHEQLLNIKKSMLEKMFPKDGADVPEIRFAGFTEPWEVTMIGDIYQINNERNNGQFPVEKTISISSMSYNEKGNGADVSSIDNYKVLRVGDLAYEGHTNKEFRYGRFVLNDLGNGIMSPRFSTLRPIVNQDFNFWKYYMHSETVMRSKLVNSTKAGTMMNELVFEDLAKQQILVPSILEQKQIGSLLARIDNTIALHQQKLDQLQNIKKSCLDKMFV